MTEEEKSRMLAARQLSNLTSGHAGCTVPVALCTLTVVFVVLSLLTLTGCRTISHTEINQKENTEVSKDSANTEKISADTTMTDHKTTEKEKTEIFTETHTEKRDSTVTVVDKDGNVIGLKEYHWLVNSIRELSSTEKQLMDSLSAYKSKSDSLSYYRHIADSLSNVQKDIKETVVDKQLSWWQKFCCDYGKIMFGASVALLVIGFFFISRLVMNRLRRRAAC